MSRGVFVLVVLFGCAHESSPGVPSAAPPLPMVSSSVAPERPGAGDSVPTSVEAAVEAGAPEAAAPAVPVREEPVVEGESFIAQARILYRVAACGAVGEIPARFDAGVVGRHCEDLRRAEEEYRQTWIDVARPVFESLRPKDLPSVIVYPFGGGDLASALATFPDATEVTTISLEPAGDVRPIETIGAARLQHELYVHRDHLKRLFVKAHSKTDNLRLESKTLLPGELVFDLVALAVYGYEPVALRYFRLRPDGTVAYLEQADFDARAAGSRTAFDHAELMFRPVGDPQAQVRVLRHIRFNLDDSHLKADPSLIAHLTAKGSVSAMTKAATHLLWDDHFSVIRGWLVGHIAWMVSDSTGIPPRIAEPAGFVQETYGVFDGPALFGAPDARDSRDVRKLFASQPKRELAFRYGYPDRSGHAHLIVTRRP
jgi:hypothetical protein